MSKFKLISLVIFIVFLISAAFLATYQTRRGLDKNTPGVDLNIDLWEYEPFYGGKTATLAGESSLQFTDNLPRLDGATALFPVYAAFAQAVYPKSALTAEANNYAPKNTHHHPDRLVRCTTTANAYENLINDEVDIIFVAGISDAHKQLAQAKGVELEFTPIGRDAFVFFVNSSNPADSLTTEQIRDIYSGKTTNWRDLGWENRRIIAYQRDANSGSQTALENMMDGTPIMDAPRNRTRSTMGDIIEVISHRNHANAIGYSFLYFTTEMVQSQEIKLLEIDGVAPTRRNIINGSYPQAGEFFAVTTKEASEQNPNIKLFIDWILGEQGQYLIEKTGYTTIN
jgi:phosphate transport system substrate-binding protein